MFGTLDSIFAVSILENTVYKEIIDFTTGNPFMFLGRPYEQFCGENLSFLLRAFDSLKLGAGISFSIGDHTKIEEHNEIMSKANFKSLRVKTSRNAQIKIRISYTVDSDNYADNLYDFLKVSKAQDDLTVIHKCEFCDKSEIFL